MSKHTKTDIITDALIKSWQNFGCASDFDYKEMYGILLKWPKTFIEV